MSNDSRNGYPKIWSFFKNTFRPQILFWYPVPSLTADKEHSNTCRVFSARNNAKTILCAKAGGARKFNRWCHQFLLVSSQRRDQWARSISAKISSNYVLCVNKTERSCGDLCCTRVICCQESIARLGGNYIDTINHFNYICVLQYRDISSDPSGVALDYTISLAVVLLKSSMINYCIL